MKRAPNNGERVWVVWEGRQVWGHIEDDAPMMSEDDPASPDAQYIVDFDEPQLCDCGCGIEMAYELYRLERIHAVWEKPTPEQLSGEGLVHTLVASIQL